mgnify:CR=1 FL=1
MAVVECLLVQSSSRNVGTLKHQISRKVPLILRRARFQNASFSSDPVEIWGQLYELRNVIAHGGSPQFAGEKLSKIGGFAVALDYALDALRALLRHALQEPELIDDLSKC